MQLLGIAGKAGTTQSILLGAYLMRYYSGITTDGEFMQLIGVTGRADG